MVLFFKEEPCAAFVPTAQLTSALQASSAMRQALRWALMALVNTHTVHTLIHLALGSPAYIVLSVKFLLFQLDATK